MGTESFQSQGCRKHAQRRKRRSPEGAVPASLPYGHLGPSGLEAGLVLARGAPDRSRPLAWRQHSPNLGPGSDGGARGLRPGYAPRGVHAARPTWVITPPTGEGVAARNPAPPSRGPPSLCPARIQRRTGSKGRLHPLNRGFPTTGVQEAPWGDAWRTGHRQRGAPGARHPERPRPSPPFLRGVLGRLGRAQARASRSLRPDRRVPFPQAAEGRLPTSRPRPPWLRRLRVASWPSPGSAYLALDLLHHLGGWGLTSDCTDR